MKFSLTIARSFIVLSMLVATNMRSHSFASEQTKDMAVKLAEICRKHDVPAMAAAVINSDNLVEAQCFGVRKRGTTDVVALSDRFPLGSCTKSMTATLAAVMVEAGKIDWKTTLGDVWPKAIDDHIQDLAGYRTRPRVQSRWEQHEFVRFDLGIARIRLCGRRLHEYRSTASLSRLRRNDQSPDDNAHRCQESQARRSTRCRSG